MSSFSNLGNSFHYNSIMGKFDKTDEVFDLGEKYHNISMNNLNFNFSGDIPEITPSNIKENDMNINENETINLNLFGKKDQGFDKSSYSLEQNFNENSHMNIEEEFEKDNNNKENYTKIGKDTGIEPIIESGFAEDGINDSFFHENNFFIHKCNDSSISLGDNNNIMNMTVSNDAKLDFFFDENELLKIKKNLINLKNSKSNSLSFTNSLTKENTFINNINKSVINDNKKIFNVTKQDNDFLSSNIKLNMSSCLLTYKPKRGRKKMLLNGIKTEIIDKTFLREFKKYLKTRQKEFARIMEEDSTFWKEFLANSSPPFSFTSGGGKIEFKSYNKKLLTFIFSKPSANHLYSQFINDSKDIPLRQTYSKKRNKKINYQTLAFYLFYRKNLHKLYSQDYSANEINTDDIDLNNISADIINSSFQ